VVIEPSDEVEPAFPDWLPYEPAPPPASTKKSIVVGAGGAGIVAELLAELYALTPVDVSALTTNVYAVAVDNPLTLTGEVALVPSTLPGVETARKSVGTPPVAAAVTGTFIAVSPLTTLAVPIVGVSATSTIFVLPAEASLYFFPDRFESLAFRVDITKSHFQTLKMTLLLKMRTQ
jgi:hypothetical protein